MNTNAASPIRYGRLGIHTRNSAGARPCQGRGRGFEALRPLQIFLVSELLPLGCRKAAWSPFFRGSVRGSGERDARVNDCGTSGLKSIFVVEADRETAELNPYGETITRITSQWRPRVLCSRSPTQLSLI